MPSDPVELIAGALAEHGDACAIAFSGAEDVLVLEYARQTGRPFRVFTLDTGRLHPETYRYLDEVERHFALRIEVLCPDAGAVEALVREKGLFSFLRDGHAECCGIRKVAPLRRHLATLTAWITGQRRDQGATRTELPEAQDDPAFRGRGGAVLRKYNPLAGMALADAWTAIRALGLPWNPLHGRGFVSIGCEPCTRPVLPGQHEREGRWWWEQAEHKECGLHVAAPRRS